MGFIYCFLEWRLSMIIFSNLKIRTKMLIIFGSVFLLCLAGIGVANYFTSAKIIENIAKTELEKTVENISSIVEISIESSIKNFLLSSSKELKKIANLYYQQYLNNEISEQEAYKRFKEIILNSKIGKTSYAAAVSGEGILEIHPFKEGQDASNQEFMKRALEMKNGYISYMWQNPNEDSPREKVGAIEFFEPWNLLIWVSSYKEEFLDLLDIQSLKNKIVNIRVGETGYPYIINTYGEIVMHPILPEGYNAQKEIVLSDYNNNNKKSTETILKELVTKKHGKVEYYWYSKNNDQNIKPRKKIVQYKYFQELDWIIITGVYVDEVASKLINLRNITILIMLIALIIVIPIVLLVSSSITKPIVELTGKASKISEGNFDVKINYRAENEIGFLGKTFENMCIDLKKSFLEIKKQKDEIENYKNRIEKYNDQLEEEVKQRTKELQKANIELLRRNKDMIRELQMAKRVQQSIIPHDKDFPTIKELTFGSKYSSMDSVGGDLYDLIKIDQDKYAVLMADVSGHGVPAALITSMAKVSFNSNSSINNSPKKVLEKVNAEIYKLIGDLEYYLSAYYGILDLGNGIFTYSNASHHPAILIRPNTNEIISLDVDGFFIGTFDSIDFEEKYITLNENDKILLFTDGIIEAKNEKGRFYRYDNLRNYIKKNINTPAKEFVNGLISDVDEFSNNTPPDDDRAVLLIEYSAKSRKTHTIDNVINVELGKADFEESINKNPEFQNTYKDIVNYIEMSNYKKALFLSQNIREKYPNNPSILNLLAIIYYKTNRFEEAHEILKTALEKDKHNEYIKHTMKMVIEKLSEK